MIRVLITGANSYVGTNLEKWLLKEPEKYFVETIDMKDPNWTNFDFSKFDVVFHVAGIAHVSTKKRMKDLYFKVNRDLAIETAKKAKNSGVKQFIFMSSMIVYNSKETRITLETKPNPDNFYGQSKLQAEEGILLLESDNFHICILRPPMIYGPNSKGNFAILVRIAKHLLMFPDYKNIRSSLYINNLTKYLQFLIDNSICGIFYPQNDEYFSTSDIVKTVRNLMGMKGFYPRKLNFLIKFLIRRTSFFRKLFGDFYYDIQPYNFIVLFKFKESIEKSVIRENYNA